MNGKTILITRPIDQAVEMIEMIRAEKGIPIAFPTIEIAPPDTFEYLDKSIDSIYMYDGIIFTSQNAVSFFFDRVKSRGDITNIVKDKMIFAVGGKTGLLLEQYGIGTISIPEKFSAVELSNLIKQESLKGKCFLFPKGNIAKETIPSTLKALGASVDEVVVYKTIPPSPENIDSIKKLFDNNSVDVVTFTSPSTVKNFFNLLGYDKNKNFSSQVRIAVIGPTTKKALEEFEIEPDIEPTQSTIQSFIESIIDYYKNITENN
ncbi:MAG: uroporphyrinogen-III synthase [Ignavibacteriales bacterium]|nr:uroporphyrinogen-III synthase [Ignavibacteriales bacterium]